MRWFWFMVRLALIVVLVLWLAGQPGTASVNWHGYIIRTTAAFLAAAVVVGAVVLSMAFRVWRWIKDGPRFWRLRNKLAKMERGQEQITKGLIAIAAGDAAEAGHLAVSARKLLGVTAATRLLQAQAAQLAGDYGSAKEIFRALAADPQSAVLGYRGLIMSAVREGNWDEAARQMENLKRQQPNTPWLSLIQFELATRRQQWNVASEALARASAARLLEQPRAKRHQAALFVASSEVEARNGNPEQALQLAEKALKQAPDWMPALIALAHKQLAAHHVRTATRTIEKAWARAPHPQLALLYQAAARGRNPLEAYKFMERLARINADHPASHLALAEAALSADLWGEARRHLIALATGKEATQSAYRLLARLERRESGNEQEAAKWLIKAAEALPDPRWLCSMCGSGHDDWQVICRSCGAFNTLSWQTPGIGRSDSQSALIAGTLGSVV
jgi:HemY protein